LNIFTSQLLYPSYSDPRAGLVRDAIMKAVRAVQSGATSLELAIGNIWYL